VDDERGRIAIRPSLRQVSAHRPNRPLLAPGTRIVPRGREAWQVGIDPARRVVVPDGPGVAAELGALREGRTPRGEPSPLRRSLAAAGLLAAPPRPPLTVVVSGTLGDGTHDLVATVGVRNLPSAGPDTPGILFSRGEPARELLDPWLRERRTHIVVRVVDGRTLIGPLVVPGQTACLRCLDCHVVDVEPEHYAVLHRYVQAGREDGRRDDVPAPTRHLAVTWALHDLLAHRDGLTPVTLSSTLALGDSGLECTSWHRHPQCACSWSGTIDS